MVFSSIGFLGLFLPIVFLAYHAVPRGWKNPLLAVASIVFYAWGEPRFVVLMLLSVAANHRAAIAIDRRDAPAARRRVLAGAVAANLALLVVFKYTHFLAANLAPLLAPLGVTVGTPPPIPLPIGISFYTFHAISYLIDVHRRNAQPNPSLVQYSLYIMLFPQLVAGPIIRYKDIHRQLGERRVGLADVEAGVVRFTQGLAKKVLIANPLALIADAGFHDAGTGLATADAWLALTCYTLQIYFDFSGYSDMAIGLARMFGFRFPENFDYPYTARSIQDFWRRWHISLSTWFRDYVYLPLGGNRGGTLRTLRNLWIVFLLTGIWHGASWNFVIWGALHGAFLTIERLLARSPLAALPVPALLRHAYALAVVMLAWVFFRADTLGEAMAFLRALAGLGAQDEHSIDLNGHESALLVLAIALALGLFPWLRERLAPLRTASARIGVDGWLRAATLGVVLVACLMSLAVGQYNPFIYFRF